MKKSIGLSLVAGLVLLTTAVPAYAQGNGRGDSGTSNKPLTAKERKEKAEPRVKERTEKIKATSEERKTVLSLEKCERNQAKLEKSIPRLANSANKLLGVTDRMYERVQGFYDKGQLTVSNYDEYQTAIDEKQLTATAAVEALNEFEFELDCEADNAGEQLDAFRISVNEARESIKSYRKELVSLISALRSAAADKEADDSSDSDTTDDTDTTDESDDETDESTDTTEQDATTEEEL